MGGRLRHRAGGLDPNGSTLWISRASFSSYLFKLKVFFLSIRETFQQGAGEEMEPLRGPGRMVIIPVEHLLDLGDPEMEDDASSIGEPKIVREETTRCNYHV